MNNTHWNIYSAVIPGRAIQILRTGTFTGMNGRETEFTPERLAEMAADYAARNKPRLPITENHNFGRAFGRMVDIYPQGEALYAAPRWNKAGREAIEEEVYNAFSIEIDVSNEPWSIVGGTLTNYPAVTGMEPIALMAPPDEDIQPAPDAAPDDSQPQGVSMSDEIQALEAPPTPETAPPIAPPTLPPAPSAADPQMQAQLNAYAAQMQQQMQAQHEAMMAQAAEQARLQFERWKAESAAHQQILSYAQHLTTPTLQRPHALPGTADEYVAFFSSIPAEARKSATALFDRILSAGLVAFDEIGSSGEGETEKTAREQYEAAVTAKMAGGLSRLAAIKAVQTEQPAIYEAYRNGGR